MSAALLIAAIVLALWAAGVAAEAVTFGTGEVLLALALACFAGSFLPWWGPVSRRTPPA